MTKIADLKAKHEAEIWDHVEDAVGSTWRQLDAAQQLGVTEAWLSRYLRKNRELVAASELIPNHRKYRIVGRW